MPGRPFPDGVILSPQYVADPGSPTAGQVWWDNTRKQFRAYDGDLTKPIVDSMGPIMATTTGWYNIGTPVSTTNDVATTFTISHEHAMPFVLGFNGTLSAIAVNVKTTGASSNVLRAGIRMDSGNATPFNGAALVDFGTVTGVGTGVKQWTGLSQILEAGRIYHFCIVSQVGTVCQLSQTSLGNPLVADLAATPSVINPMGTYSQVGVTGALPASWSMGTVQMQALKVLFKFSAASR